MATINVFHIVSGNTWSGAERYAADVMTRLRHDTRFYSEMVCGKNDAIIAQFQHLEIPVSILPLRGIADIDSPMRLARMLKRGQNIVHAHTVKDAVTAVLAKRISENPHTRVLLTHHGMKKPRISYLHKKALAGVDRFVSVSQTAQEAFAQHARKVNLRKSVVIRESVLPSPAPAVPVDVRRSLRVHDGQVLLIYHGRLSHDKGVGTLLRAVTQLDKSTYHLAIAGEGQPKAVKELKAFAIANQLVGNVTFMGFQKDMQHILAQADVSVLPSTQPEALGMTCLEAMMLGLPVITTDNGAQREYITDGRDGVLVPPGDFMRLATEIKTLVDDESLRRQLGRNAREAFEAHLSYDRFYRELTTLYLSLF